MKIRPDKDCSNLTHNASRGAAWHGASQLCLTASGYVVAVVLARSLGPVDFGAYGVIYSLLMALELTVILGIPGAIARLISQHDSDEIHLGRSAVTMVTLCTVLAFAVLWAAAPWVAETLHVPNGTVLFRVAIVDIPCFGAYHVVSHILNGRRDFTTQSVATILYSLTKVLGMLALAYTGISIAGALWVNVLASVVGLIVVTRTAGVGLFRPTLLRAAPILRLAGPVAIIGVGTQFLLYVDLWSIGAFGGGESVDTGFYVAAKNLARIPNLISFVLMAVLVPSIGRARALGDVDSVLKLTRGTTRFLAVTLLPGCALMAVESKAIMELMFSTEYAPGAEYLTILVLANGLFHTVLTTGIAVLIATERQKLAAIIAVSAIVPSLVCSALLVPRFGALGAAYGTLLASMLASVIVGFAVRREVGRLFDQRVLSRSLAVTALVCGIAYLVNTPGLLLIFEMALLLPAVLALCAVLGVITRADLQPFMKGPASTGSR